LVSHVGWMLYYPQRLAYADCIRCGELAFPTSGYCSRYCHECDLYDDERRTFGLALTKPGYHCKIEGLE
jgi:hypothetical protein